MYLPQQPGEAERLIGGRFQLGEMLGRGGMGAVYRVCDVRSGVQLALKRGQARNPQKDQKRKALLEREYHTLAQLAHPCIIEVYDYGVDELGPYYTMELLEGQDLEQRGRLPWREACALLRDVASSLAILQSRGLLHRDVSSRNVRCTADGRAKLLDFGAMVCMGVAKSVVGTPPYVAPEALQMQALDARADLFSLGALAYYVLTGRNAFPARRLAELRDLWRSAPIAPSRLVPELPPELSRLTLQLLSLDRGARPQNAAEVMERLCAIAGLPIDERPEVSRAYLATPTLIGREPALLEVRRRMLSLVRGDGGSVLIEGPSGSGRSRMLDACVLEAKLLGAAVLRADQSDGANGEWGVLRALGTQLCELMPGPVNEAVRLSRDVVAHVIESLRTETTASAPTPERSLLLRELRDLFLNASRVQRLLIVIDDADRIDEPSAACLAALASKCDGQGVLLALSGDSERESEGSASLRLLRSYAETIALAPLAGEQTEALVRSLFGDVENLQLIAARIDELARGNPRATMDLAQHLLDRGVARYEAGRWSLPSELDPGDLPDSLTASLGARLRSLSEDALEIARGLCLAEGDTLRLADYAALSPHGDNARMFRALDELVAKRVLLADGERYRFSQQGFLPLLEDGLPTALRRSIHARLADCLATRATDPMRRAHHLLLGGREREGVELLYASNLKTSSPPLALAELALVASERLGLPARIRHELRNAIVNKAPRVLAVDTFRRQLPKVLAQLEHDSGLELYRESSEETPSARLQAALARTQARYHATPEHERVYAPLEAIRELAQFSASACAIGMLLHDLDFLEALPSLEPLLPLSPSLTVVFQALEACKEGLRCRTYASVRAFERVLARLAEPDHAGFDETSYRGIVHGIHYLLGLVAASMGIPAAEQHAQLLEADREHRVNAWRVRVALHLNQGNPEEAKKCQRRAELLLLQEETEQRYVGTSAGFELIANAMAGDMLGVKQALDGVAKLAGRHVGWQPLLLLGRCHYRWLQGDRAAALETLLPALELARPGRHPYYPYVAAAQIGLLRELGRVEEAVTIGREHLEHCRRERLASTDRWVFLAVGLALASAGQHAEAVALIDEAIAASEALHMVGLSLGALYEARARVAVWFDDRPAWKSYCLRCGNEYKKGRNPVLSARLARLLEEAHARDAKAEEEPLAAPELVVVSQTETAYETIESRLQECLDRNERARCALTIALESLESKSGCLFGVDAATHLTLLAALPEREPDSSLRRWLEAALVLEAQSGGTATADGDEIAESTPNLEAHFTDGDGRVFVPIFLGVRSDRDERIAAVLALQIEGGHRPIPPKELLSELAFQLVALGDVVGVAL